MTTLHIPTLTAASLLLVLAAGVAVAQTVPAKPAAKPAAKTAVKPAAKPAGKTLGGGTIAAGAKLMSRDELRRCLQRRDDLNQSGKDLEALRPPLDRERDELMAAGESLKSERAELDRQLAVVREWEGKVRAHTADVEAYNKRFAAAAEAPRNQQEKLGEELKTERERLQKLREALAADETRLVPAYRASTKAYNERVTARDAKVSDWNAGNAAAVEASVKQQEARTLWLDECANRPYLEDDEFAIKAGK